MREGAGRFSVRLYYLSREGEAFRKLDPTTRFCELDGENDALQRNQIKTRSEQTQDRNQSNHLVIPKRTERETSSTG